jgi:AcrR family transcriptional regulator
MSEADIPSIILEAAECRFKVYGFNKTTMAEISADCDMSAANLYRYFKNKVDIGAALAQQCLAEKEALLTTVVDDGELKAYDKLLNFVMLMLDYTYRHCDEDPKMNELVQAMTTQRPDLIMKHRNNMVALIARLLEQGKQRGEFYFQDINVTAEATFTALIMFYHPLVIVGYAREDIENKATHLCQLIFNGLKPN